MPIDYSKYPPDWFDVIRPAVLKKANYKCTKCRVAQRATGYRDALGNFIECDTFLYNWATANGKKILKIYLSVAHLNHNIEDNRPENLAPLCQQCHNRHDAKNRALNRTVAKRKKKG